MWYHHQGGFAAPPASATSSSSSSSLSSSLPAARRPPPPRRWQRPSRRGLPPRRRVPPLLLPPALPTLPQKLWTLPLVFWPLTLWSSSHASFAWHVALSQPASFSSTVAYKTLKKWSTIVRSRVGRAHVTEHECQWKYGAADGRRAAYLVVLASAASASHCVAGD
jgi:hypothetical protein